MEIQDVVIGPVIHNKALEEVPYGYQGIAAEISGGEPGLSD
jgi:hypothetical protein